MVFVIMFRRRRCARTALMQWFVFPSCPVFLFSLVSPIRFVIIAFRCFFLPRIHTIRIAQVMIISSVATSCVSGIRHLISRTIILIRHSRLDNISMNMRSGVMSGLRPARNDLLRASHLMMLTRITAMTISIARRIRLSISMSIYVLECVRV